MEVIGTNGFSCLLRLNKSLYGLKNDSLNWHNKLKMALEDRGFVESLSDPCVFIRKNMRVLVYVDNCILVSKDPSVVEQFIQSLKDGKENFDFTDKGSMSSYLGVDVSRLPADACLKLSQPFLIDRIIQAVNFDPKTTKGVCGNTPARHQLLSKAEDGPAGKATWKYRAKIGMLGYLQGTSHSDVSMSSHQCARFNNSPNLSHKRAAKNIVRYLLDTKYGGLSFKPDTLKVLECYVDTDFAGGWKDKDQDSPELVLYRTGSVIMYAGSPIR